MKIFKVLAGILGILIFAVLISQGVSAASYYDDCGSRAFCVGSGQAFRSPTSSFSASKDVSYTESPGLEVFPTESLNQNTNVNTWNNNFDTSTYSRDYRGPMYEVKYSYLNDYSKSVDDDGWLFFSDWDEDVRHVISATKTEKYVGASESVYFGNQNKRTSGSSATDNTDYEYDGGFTFGKQRKYDSSEYAEDSYTEPYYYRPYYDSNRGRYIWDY